VRTEELVIAFPPGHALATGAPTRFSGLREEPFVSLPEDSGLRATLAEAAGVSPRVPFEARDYRRIAELVRHGLGVALMPRSLAGDVTASLNPPLAQTIRLVRRKGRQTRAACVCRERLNVWSARISPQGPLPA
jgi:DNA-binding transcriptional LysR family regulator